MGGKKIGNSGPTKKKKYACLRSSYPSTRLWWYVRKYFALILFHSVGGNFLLEFSMIYQEPQQTKNAGRKQIISKRDFFLK